MHPSNIGAQSIFDDRTPCSTLGTGKHENPVHGRRKVRGIASLPSLVAAAVTAANCLAPVAAAKDAESGQVCTGPQNVATACHPSPEAWPPPGPPAPGCLSTGSKTIACGRQTTGLARQATQGTGIPTSLAKHDGAKWGTQTVTGNLNPARRTGKRIKARSAAASARRREFSAPWTRSRRPISTECFKSTSPDSFSPPRPRRPR
jgi:hypothetical protein